MRKNVFAETMHDTTFNLNVEIRFIQFYFLTNQKIEHLTTIKLNGKQKRVCLSGLEYPRKLINTST
jgi:hypothetical protein